MRLTVSALPSLEILPSTTKLTYYHKEGEASSRRGRVDLNESTSLVMSQSDSDYIIKVLTPYRELKLKSKDEEVTKSWFESFKEAIKRKERNTAHSSSFLGHAGEVLLTGFLGKSKVMSRETLVSENWMQSTSRWTTFTSRFLVLCKDEAPDETESLSFSLLYFTDESCRVQRGCLKITASCVASFQSTKVPWRAFAEQDLRVESIPIFLTLSSDDWLVILIPREEEESIQWRTALDTTVHHLKTQAGLKTKDTLGQVTGS